MATAPGNRKTLDHQLIVQPAHRLTEFLRAGGPSILSPALFVIVDRLKRCDLFKKSLAVSTSSSPFLVRAFKNCKTA